MRPGRGASASGAHESGEPRFGHALPLHFLGDPLRGHAGHGLSLRRVAGAIDGEKIIEGGAPMGVFRLRHVFIAFAPWRANSQRLFSEAHAAARS
jgi:hypothetical protein